MLLILLTSKDQETSSAGAVLGNTSGVFEGDFIVSIWEKNEETGYCVMVALPLLGTYPKKSKPAYHRDIYISRFTTVGVPVEPEPAKLPSTDDWVKTIRCVQTMESFLPSHKEQNYVT